MARTLRNAMLIEETRKRVQTSQLLNRLHDHIFGDAKMSQTQLKAAEILLRKSLPDLSATTADITITHRMAETLSDDELASIATRGGADAAQTPADTPVVH